jgi:hypothetical protein
MRICAFPTIFMMTFQSMECQPLDSSGDAASLPMFSMPFSSLV